MLSADCSQSPLQQKCGQVGHGTTLLGADSFEIAVIGMGQSDGESDGLAENPVARCVSWMHGLDSAWLCSVTTLKIDCFGFDWQNHKTVPIAESANMHQSNIAALFKQSRLPDHWVA